MPRKRNDTGTIIVNVRMTIEQSSRIDEMVGRGISASRSEFIRDAINLKIFYEDTRAAKFTLTPKQ